jgi:pyruvate/2-oxoglutarate/acetoin dehydrogenase E1 component
MPESVKELNFNMKYFNELKRAMTWLGQQPNTFFLGQAVTYVGTAMTNTLKEVPSNKLWEMPVCEDMQMGMSIGMALNGTIPISLFPRWNFFLLATNQVVNHLDKISMMADDPYKPKVIIRTAIGSERPLHPQHQHVGDYTDAFRLMCKNIEVIRLDEPEQIFPAYERAYLRQDSKSTIIVEWGDYYNEK